MIGFTVSPLWAGARDSSRASAAVLRDVHSLEDVTPARLEAFNDAQLEAKAMIRARELDRADRFGRS